MPKTTHSQLYLHIAILLFNKLFHAQERLNIFFSKCLFVVLISCFVHESCSSSDWTFINNWNSTNPWGQFSSTPSAYPPALSGYSSITVLPRQENSFPGPQLFLFGGVDQNGSSYDALWRFDLGSTRWYWLAGSPHGYQANQTYNSIPPRYRINKLSYAWLAHQVIN